MKIAFTTKGKTMDSQIEERFGRTQYILVYDDENQGVAVTDNQDSKDAAHGAGPKMVQKLFKLGVNTVITGTPPGANATQLLNQSDIKIFKGANGMTAEEAYTAYKNGDLEEFNC